MATVRTPAEEPNGADEALVQSQAAELTKLAESHGI
jgi:hypothetical protein